MKNVAFVAPLFRPNTTRYIRAFADLPGVQLALIGMDEPRALDPSLHPKVAAYARVRDVGDPDELARAARGLRDRLGGLDAIASSLEELQVQVAVARDRVGIPGMGEAVARNFRDKARMKDVLRRHGLPVGRHRLVGTAAEAREFAAEVGYPIVVKPPAGRGARSTSRASDEGELLRALGAIGAAPQSPMQCEEFVTGTEHTCETVMIGGRAVWHSGTHYVNPPLEILENPWMQYCVVLPREEPEALSRFLPTNDRALAALGLDTGLSHMEWFDRGDGRAVIGEVGARPPGANITPMMSIAFDTDMVRNWAALVAFGTFDPPVRRYAAGTAFFRGQGAGRVVAVHGLDEARREVGGLIVDWQPPAIGAPRATSYEGEGWAIVRADDTATVVRALRALVTTVRVEYSDKG